MASTNAENAPMAGENTGRSTGIANLRPPWRKGESGNPGGRPKTANLSKACREMLEQPFPNDSAGRTYAQVIAAKLAEDAANGNLQAAREIADRAEGRPQQAVQLDIKGQQFDRMTSEELLRYAESGDLPACFESTSEDSTPETETPDA